MATPKSGITCRAYKGGVLQQTGVTNENGIVNFVNIPTGVYEVRIDTPPGFSVDVTNPLNASPNSQATTKYGQYENTGELYAISVTKNNLSTAQVVIAQAIYLHAVFVKNSPTSYTLSLAASAVVPEQVVVKLSHRIERLFGGELERIISNWVDTVFIIPINTINSNVITVSSGFDMDYPMENGDVLVMGYSELIATAVSPGRVVFDVSHTIEVP